MTSAEDGRWSEVKILGVESTDMAKIRKARVAFKAEELDAEVFGPDEGQKKN